MKQFCALILGLYVAAGAVASEVSFNVYQQEAYKNALTLIVTHFGAGYVVEEFGPAPGGTFSFIAHHPLKGDVKHLFLLPDQQHLVEGKLYSKLGSKVSTEAAPGVKSKVALNNAIQAQQEDYANSIKQRVAPGPLSPSLFKLSEADFSNHSEPKETNLVSSAPTKKDSSLEDARDAHFIEIGQSAKVLYVYVDFECPACHSSSQVLEDEVAKGNVTVRYIPVGVLGEESVAKATYALIPNPNDSRLGSMRRLYGSTPIREIVPHEAPKELLNRGWRRYKENTQKFFVLDRPVTPTYVFNTDSGPVVGAFTPAKISQLIQHIVPEVPGSDDDAPHVVQAEARRIEASRAER